MTEEIRVEELDLNVSNENELMEMRSKSKLGRNDKCWCGSGKKFKRCHLGREVQEPLGKQEVLERFYSLYEKGDCLHPDADSSTCSGKIIKAHTIQRNGGLTSIARRGHVYSLLKHGRWLNQSHWEPHGGPSKIGIREASTFTGFCARHDNELFAPLEKEPFHGTMDQIALLGYRTICYELYMKERGLAGSDLWRELDRGQPLLIQRASQEALTLHDIGVKKAIGELKLLKEHYDKVIFNKCFSDLDYYVVELDNNPEVMCSGTAQATHNFSGEKVHQLGLGTSGHWLTFSLIATDTGGAAVFTWLSEHTKSRGVVTTLQDLTEEDLPHAIIRFTFEFFENTYFAPEWWDSLEKQVQFKLKERQLRDIIGPWGENEHPRPDNCLIDDGVRAVHWTVQSRMTSLLSDSSPLTS